MLKRLLSLVLTTIIVLSAFTAFPVSVNAEKATELTDSTDTYSPTEEDSTATIPTEPATELGSEKETGLNTELPSATPIATESSTENKEDSFNTVEIQTKPELASTGTTSETYEQAARYVPNYVITGTNTIQPMYNPYTVQMLLDMNLSAYEISKSDDWSYALVTHSYSQVYRVENNAVYGISESTNILNIIDQNYFSSLNATVGLKRVEYNGQTKYAIAIAFRGTNSKDIADLVDDISAFPNFNGIHKGFADNANNFYNLTPNIVFSIDGNNISLYDMIQDMKNEDSPYCMLVTGHSLGGATADVFVGCNLYSAGVKPSKVLAYTFAAPKSAYYNSYPYKNIINIINEDDFVPTVGASKRVGTDFRYTPDDTFRQAHYKNHYEEGHGTAWWSSLVNEVPHFISHDLEEVYQSIIDSIQNNTNDYTNYSTNGDNYWSTSVKLNAYTYRFINGNLNANEVYFDSGRIEVNGDLTVFSIDMRVSEDYLLVCGNFEIQGRGYSMGLSNGTVELKGDFLETNSLVSGYTYYRCSYYEQDNHKTVFSGNSTQTIKFENPTYSRFVNLYLNNTDIIFDSDLYSLTLNQDTILPNTKHLKILNELNLNGYKLSVNGSLNANKVCLNGGEVKADSVSFSQVTVQRKNNVIDGTTYISSLYFKEGQLEVKSDCTVYSMDMRASEDYLLVCGNFEIQGRGYSMGLSNGTVELKGDFLETNSLVSGDTYYRCSYYEQDNHKTVFSGNSTQTIKFENPTYSRFANLYLLNYEGVVFNSKISVTHLFNHNRNSFTLYNNGVGSTFVDYDGDGMLDHVDPYPTDPNNTPPTQEPTQNPTQELTQAPTQEPSNSPMLLGDVDGDGTVTIIDATCIQRHLASIPTFAFIEALADTDGDGGISIIDATYIQRWLAYLPSNDNIGKPIE